MTQTFTLTNGTITAEFSTFGAEMISLKNTDGKEFLFRDKSFWDFTAPVLFPICGGLREGKFILDGREYFLKKHGFARTAEFVCEEKTETGITFLLTETEETLAVFPFRFEFRIIYTLDGGSVNITYSVTNKTDGNMYFSVGSHEAYLCPEGIENYTVVFEKAETLDAHIVNGELLEHKTDRIITDSTKLPLKKSYFDIDALAFSKFNSHSVTVEANDGTRSVKIDYPGCSHLMIWTKKGGEAPYICIEPWFGFPDMTDSDCDITKKPGIVNVQKDGMWKATHSITPIK